MKARFRSPFATCVAGAALVLGSVATLGPGPARADVRATPLEGPAPRRPEHARGTGAVVYVTAERVYLDVGAADGLSAGDGVVARRKGEAGGRCTVDLVAEHASSCRSTALRPGDAVTFQAAPEPAPPKVLPAVVAEEDLARRAAALQSAPPAPLVEFKAAPTATVAQPEVRGARWLSAEASFAQWSSTDARELGAATVDLSIRNAEVGAGLVLDVAARAERWVPAANPRFRPRDDTRFYLWQAELTAPLSRLTLSAGRVLPYAIPGATVFDGASAAVRVGPAQLGVFGGVVPEPDTLSPTADRATGGAFWSITHLFAGGAGVRQDGRVAIVRSPELGTRFEATVGAGAWWKAAYLSGEAQLGAGGTAQAPGHLDAARTDVTLHVARSLAVGGGYRHGGLTWPAPAGTLEPALFPGRSDAADGWASIDVWIFRLGATGGFSRDGAARLERSWAGPELGIPRLLGRYGGVSAGYLEERGWLPGRSAWTQATFRPSPRFSLLARGTWTKASNAAVDADEVGLLASGSAELGRGFGLRATVLSRTGLQTGEGAGSSPLGVTAMAGLYAAY